MAEITAPETTARNALIAHLEEVFSSEKFPVLSDKLHGSVGYTGTQIGVYPLRATPWRSDVYVLDVELVVQFYGEYNLEVDPTQTVDPTTVEECAERFRRSMRENLDPGTDEVWYFQLKDLKYTPDPTGNISRFDAVLVARCRNAEYVETF